MCESLYASSSEPNTDSLDASKETNQNNALPEYSSKQMHLLAQVTKPIVQPSIFGFGSTTKMRQTLTPPQESLDLSLTRVCLSQTIRGGPKRRP